MRIYFFFMGIFVTAGGFNHKDEEAKVVISNHISCLDSVALETIVPTWRVNEQSCLPSLFTWLLGFKNSPLTWKEDIRNLSLDIPFSFFPEEETTNGKAGLLKFNKLPLELAVGRIQPVVLLSNRPWFMPVNVNYIHSTFWSDLFWMLYIPFTQYHICYLPSKEIPKQEEQIEDFTQSLQRDMAMVLDVEATNHTAHDKREYIKRIRHEENLKQEQLLAASRLESPRRQLPNKQKVLDKQLNQMIEQVKVVLPQVPISLIKFDLHKTTDVNITISNFLEGSLQFTPLTEEEQETERTQLVKEREGRTEIVKNNSVSSFGKTSWDRHLSFQERKNIMIDEARRKYLELHPEYR